MKENNPNIKLLLIIPPPLCAYRWGDRDHEAGRKPQRTAEHTALYAAKAKSIAEELHIPYVDLWTGFLSAAGWTPGAQLLGSTSVAKSETLGKLLPDGLHFSAQGNKLCFKLIYEEIVGVYPELVPENMETNVPLWDMEKDILAILRDGVAKLSVD